MCYPAESSIIKETTSRPDEFLESALCPSIDDVVCCVLLVDTLERTRPDATSSGFARAKSFALFPSERFTAYIRSSVLLDLFAFPPRAVYNTYGCMAVKIVDIDKLHACG
jgi:hypothetical protein